MRYRNFYVAILLFFAGVVSQNTSKVYSQSSELIDLTSGKPIERNKLSRFTITSRARGIVTKANIKFYSSLIETSDEQKITRNIYQSESKSDLEKYFKIHISEPRKILERGKTKNTDSPIFERIVSEVEEENRKSYEIIIYGSGKSFISIIAKNLDLALECEKWLGTQK